jgi:hypothetical protein
VIFLSYFHSYDSLPPSMRSAGCLFTCLEERFKVKGPDFFLLLKICPRNGELTSQSLLLHQDIKAS